MKIGKYEIPDMRLNPTLIDATRIIYEKYKSEDATNQLAVAQLLGHKGRSGAFLQKLACLRSYGLIERRGIKVTDAGRRLTWGLNDEEKGQAAKEVVLNIPLWKEFYLKWGKELPPQSFWADLSVITGLDTVETQKIENIVKDAYLDDIRNIKEIQVTETPKLIMPISAETILKNRPVDESYLAAQAEILKGLFLQRAYKLAKDFIDFVDEREKAEEIKKGVE